MPGTTYVALSRVKSLSSCVVEPISYERLTSLKSSKTSQYQLNEEVRVDKMDEVTFKVVIPQVILQIFFEILIKCILGILDIVVLELIVCLTRFLFFIREKCI